MPKPIVWIDGNHQDLTTGHKTFERQNRAILSGQVIGDTQNSGSVRPRSETVNPVGSSVKPGYLRDFDLRTFPQMPWYVRNYILGQTQDKGVLVHEFFTYRSGRKVLIGYLILRGKKIIAGFCTSGRAKGFMVLDAVAPYVADMDEGEEVPYQYGRF